MFLFSVFFLVLVSIETVYQTRKTVFEHISKHVEVGLKNTPLHVVISTFLSVFGNVVKQGLLYLISPVSREKIRLFIIFYIFALAVKKI